MRSRSRLATALGAGALSLPVLAPATASTGASVAVADARDRGWSPVTTVGPAPVAVRHAVADINLDGEAVALWQDSTGGPVETHLVPDVTHSLRRQAGAPSLSKYKREVRGPVDDEGVAGFVTDWAGRHLL